MRLLTLAAFWAGLLTSALGYADAGAGTLGSAAARSGADAADKLVPHFVPGDCAELGLPQGSRCGSVRVPENRTTRTGRVLDLYVTVVPATSSAPALGPVFFLAGGPGEAASGDAAATVEFLANVRQRRDLVLVDLRGTGHSHPLRCATSGTQTPGRWLEPAEVRACRERLEKDTDLRQYTTAAAVDDLDDVRAALGYSRVDLVGDSYGTQVAQVFLRRHPQVVRSAVLIAPLPLVPDSLLFDARDAERALHLLFSDCAANAACRHAFPDPTGDLLTVLRRLDAGAVEVQLGTAPPLLVHLDRDLFVRTLRTRLYSARAAARVPRALHAAAAGDFRDMANAAAVISQRQADAISWGFFLSVMCSEVLPFLDPTAVDRLADGTWLGGGRVHEWLRACPSWTSEPVAATDLVPLRSDVPALLLTGRLDPVCPPYWGEQVSVFLTHARHVVLEAAGHFPDGPCARSLISGFIEAGSAELLDSTCARDAKRPEFALPEAHPRVGGAP